MRLLIVSQYFWPEHFRVNDLACELAERGWAVTVLTGQPNYPTGDIFPEYRRDKRAFDRLGAVRVVRVPILPRGRGSLRLVMNYLSFVVSAASIGIWKLRGQQFDAIFMFDTSPITSALPAVLLRRIKRAPLLMWVLDLWPETLSAIGVVKSRHALALVGRLVAFIYRRTDRILVQSRAFEANVKRYASDTTRMRYFPAWAEVGDTLPPAPEIAALGTGFTVLFAGNIGEAQDFPSILASAEALRDIAALRFVIVGSGRAEDWLRKEIARRSLETRILLLGRHPVERMPEFFAGADALLVSLKPDPVFAMTIPGKVQTYLASGKPILAMLDGEGAKIIMDAGAGFAVPAGDAEQLATSIRRLIALTPAERQAMGERGRVYCKANFDRDMLMEKLIGWVAEAMSGQDGKRHEQKTVPANGPDQKKAP